MKIYRNMLLFSLRACVYEACLGLNFVQITMLHIKSCTLVNNLLLVSIVEERSLKSDKILSI